MQTEFWHQRWENEQIGFHLGEVNAILLKYWSDFHVKPDSRILVPLCGKTLDIIWLLRQGMSVVGVELSEIALDELAALIESELGIRLTKASDQGRVVYRGERVVLIAADFFRLTAEDIGRVDLVYDRAALIALPETMRADYAAHLMALSQGAEQFLITLNYDQQRMDGPPFAVAEDEVLHHYQQRYCLTMLESREIIDQEPRFKAKGLLSFKQDVYRLQPR